jgi:3-phenylpropionate/trans-cinnamate dioxygenase alpha subunit
VNWTARSGGLIPVAQLDRYKGLWFATFDPTAPPLLEYLGEMAWYINTFVDRREGGIEIVATHKWIMLHIHGQGGAAGGQKGDPASRNPRL